MCKYTVYLCNLNMNPYNKQIHKCPQCFFFCSISLFKLLVTLRISYLYKVLTFKGLLRSCKVKAMDSFIKSVYVILGHPVLPLRIFNFSSHCLFQLVFSGYVKSIVASVQSFSLIEGVLACFESTPTYSSLQQPCPNSKKQYNLYTATINSLIQYIVIVFIDQHSNYIMLLCVQTAVTGFDFFNR